MDVKIIIEMINEFLKDMWLKWILRVLIGCLLIAFIWGWVDYRKDCDEGKHAKFLWWERNIPKGYPDTLWMNKLVYKDTCSLKSTILDKSTNKGHAISVKSYGQKGGQTSNSIINNPSK